MFSKIVIIGQKYEIITEFILGMETVSAIPFSHMYIGQYGNIDYYLYGIYGKYHQDSDDMGTVFLEFSIYKDCVDIVKYITIPLTIEDVLNAEGSELEINLYDLILLELFSNSPENYPKKIPIPSITEVSSKEKYQSLVDIMYEKIVEK